MFEFNVRALKQSVRECYSRKVSNAKGHSLLSIMPRVKPSSYNLMKETYFKPKINTMHFKNSFINRLVFKDELAM